MLPELDDEEEDEEDELLELEDELLELDDDDELLEELVTWAPLELDEPPLPAPPQPTKKPNINKDVVIMRTPESAVLFVVAPSEDK